MVVFFLVPFSLVGIGMASFTTYGQIGSYFFNDDYMFPNKIMDLWVVAALLWVISLFSIRLVFWQIFGQESVRFINSGVELTKNYGLFKKSELHPYNEIKKFARYDDKEPLEWTNFWGFGPGKIVIKKSITETHFGLDISYKRALTIVDKLNSELVKRRG